MFTPAVPAKPLCRFGWEVGVPFVTLAMARRGPRERSRAAAGKPPDALWQERPARPAQTAASDAVIARAPAHPLAKRTTSEGRTTGPPHGRTIAPKNAEDAVTEAASGNLLQRRARKPVAELGGEPYTLWLRSLRPRNRVWGKPFMSPNRRQDPPRSDSASSACFAYTARRTRLVGWMRSRPRVISRRSATRTDAALSGWMIEMIWRSSSSSNP